MKDGGFEPLVFEDAMQDLIDLLNSIGESNALTVGQLEEKMRNADFSCAIVMLLRFLTSCEVQRRQDHFLPFIMVGTLDDTADLGKLLVKKIFAESFLAFKCRLVACIDLCSILLLAHC
jgi:Peptidase C65 Otubain